MSRLRPRHYHSLKFQQPDKKVVDHGSLLSFSDSEGRKIAGEVTIQRLAKLNEFSAMSDPASLPKYFLFGAPSDKDKGDSNKKFAKYLSENPQRCAMLYLDSAGTIGILSACENEDLKAMGHPTGYRCYVIDKSVLSTSQSNAGVSNSSNQFSLSGNKRGLEQLAAMEHYNENLNRDRSTRHQSQIFHMRNLNNCVKSTVIRLAVQSQPKRPLRVIDFGCGMGGDILKWAKSCSVSGLARYVGVDIAKASLEQFASERLETFRGDSCKLISHLICADVGHESLSDPNTKLETHTWVPAGSIPGGPSPRAGRSIVGIWNSTPSPLAASPSDQFDIASCQFAAHYMFQSRAQADNFFGQISQRLRTGGVFVCTTIDCRIIADMICAAESGSREFGDENKKKLVNNDKVDRKKSADLGQKKELFVKNSMGNTLLRITFSKAHWDTVLGLRDEDGPEEERGFGVQYNFALLDSADSKAVNAPEWLIPQGPPLHNLAKRHGLRVRSVENFHDFVIAHSGDRSEGGLGHLLEELGAFNYKGSVSAAEWEIARCYCVMIFEQETIKEDPGLAPLLQSLETDKVRLKSDHKEKENPSASATSKDASASVSVNAPSNASYTPSSPLDSPPEPSFQPHSPDSSPPPTFSPKSPDSSPPRQTFQPQSPDSSPPSFVPHSPESSPPRETFAPTSPESSPPSDAMKVDEDLVEKASHEEEDDDPFVAFLKRVRTRAVLQAGGNRKWDKLGDDARDALLESCQLALEAEGDGPV